MEMMSLKLPGARNILLYGLILAGLLFILKWMEMRFLVFNYAFEIYIGSIALIFTGLGIWLALKLTGNKTKIQIVEKQVFVKADDFQRNDIEVLAQNLSQRELEVLELMAAGQSNQEIADSLFVSINTVKTHTSNILQKMEVKRRTQAVEKAKRLNIIR